MVEFSYRKDWMTDDQFECYEMLADLFGGYHHVYNEPKDHGGGICLNTSSHRMATFDFNALTTAVFMAHDRKIRVEIAPSGPGMVKLCLWKRHKREGMMHERHATIATALADYRKRFPDHDEQSQP